MEKNKTIILNKAKECLWTTTDGLNIQESTGKRAFSLFCIMKKDAKSIYQPNESAEK